MHAYYRARARFKRDLKAQRRFRTGLSFGLLWSLSAILRIARVVMGKLYARDDDGDSADKRSTSLMFMVTPRTMPNGRFVWRRIWMSSMATFGLLYAVISFLS